MSVLNCTFPSQVLEKDCQMNVLLPDPPEESPLQREEPDILYLLHGLSDDHTAWLYKTSIERYAREYNLAVFMPSVDRSFYADMVSGPRYFEFIAEELPEIVRNLFRIGGSREKTFTAGLSMGGYGAFKLALNYPDRYKGAASLSGCLDIALENTDTVNDLNLTREFELIWGSPPDFTANKADLLHIMGKLAKIETPLPRLFQCCGTEDFLFEHNLNFRNRAIKLGIDVEYMEDPGFAHTWDYWDMRIITALEWMGLQKF